MSFGGGKVIWLHFPAAVWGALIEIAGWTCPLHLLKTGSELRADRQATLAGLLKNISCR